MIRFSKKPINYGRHSISRKDIRAVKKILRSDWLTIGPEVSLFEKDLTEYVGCNTIVVSSGTAALHCAYRAIGINPGDEIITPSITFIATQAAAVQSGARIVFADVNPRTGLIDPDSVKSLVTKRTKAVVAVDYAGIPADIEALRKICESNDLILIQDASHSIGATYKNRRIGSLADITIFSFFPTKNMTTGEGGAIASTNKDYLERARLFARQGVIRDPNQFLLEVSGNWHHEFHSFGLNYRLTDVMSALGRTQLKRLDSFLERRREIAHFYFDSLGKNINIELPIIDPDVEPAWHFFPILVDPSQRSLIFEKLHESGIRVQVNYIPVHTQPVFASLDYPTNCCPGANRFYAREISLPIHPKLTNQDLKRISNKVIDLVSDTNIT
jgi:dTDP-4-amino-4,6-dideoxygalactose transaminase